MCGISGVFALNGPLDPEVRLALPAINGALAHRGPDGDGFFNDITRGYNQKALFGSNVPESNVPSSAVTVC